MVKKKYLLFQLGEVDTRPVKEMISKSHLVFFIFFTSFGLIDIVPLSKPLWIDHGMDHHA